MGLKVESVNQGTIVAINIKTEVFEADDTPLLAIDVFMIKFNRPCLKILFQKSLPDLR